MAAKLLHSLTDDNPDLKKQIGCMTGIFQLFDRHHILSGHSPKRLPPGSSHINSGSPEAEPYNIYHRQKAKEKDPNKSLHERQRVSMDSSRASFSSSSRSSSFSSPDCNRIARPEPVSIGPIVFPETPLRDMAMNQSNASPQPGRQLLDLRDVVKDSMYREARVLLVTSATKEEATDRVLMHRDSPRPLQVSKTVDGSHSLGPSGKQNLPVDLKESLRVLAKLQDAPRYFTDTKERSRLSCELKDGSLYSTPKDAPRFSYDGREINRLSFESRDIFKTTPKLKELPRLSFDSKVGSVRGFNSDLKSNIPRNSQDSGNSNICISSLQQTSVSQTRPPSVVAKLMGLEALPDSALASDSQVGLIRTCPVEGSDPFTRPSKSIDPCRSIQISNSSKNSSKGLTSPRWKNLDSVMKPVSRFPIEPAPWKQPDRSRNLQKPSCNNRKGPVVKTPDSFPSVYYEIEKRLKDLELSQSGKDLRALKQILETMQAKGFLETGREEQDSNFANRRNHEQKYLSPDQSAKLVGQQKPQNERVVNSTNRADSSRTYKSPIVVMKPAKLTEKSSSYSSLTPTDGLSGLSKFRGGDFVDSRKGLVNRETAKDRIPKTSRRDNNAVNPSEIKTSSRNLKLAQTSTRPQQLPKVDTANSVRSSGSMSPRLQPKKLELEKRSRPPTHPSDSSKSRRQSNKQQPESGSPGGKRRPKPSNLYQSDESELSSETRNLVYQDDELSSHSDSIVALDLKMDVDVTSSDQSAEAHGCRSPSMKATKYSVSSLIHQKSTLKMCDDGSLVEIATVALEHPSPVSVLDGTVYRDDDPSPVKQLPGHLQDNGTWNSNNNSSKEQWDTADNPLSNSLGSNLTSELSRKKLQNVEQLVQKLRQLNSNHDEARTDYIASLCEDTNPDHRYISEILLASGLLLRDLGSSLTTFQLHPSGHPINPELFLVLEQTKGSISLTDECSHETSVHSKPDKEKFHRKLIFDAINEILAGKLAAVVPSPEPWLRPNKMARKTLNAQKLLRELCSEVEQLQTNELGSSLEDEDDLKSILWNDVMHRSESWTDFHGEIYGVVLDVERLIFKDLVGEVVIGEAAGFQARSGRRCRQLFAK